MQRYATGSEATEETINKVWTHEDADKMMDFLDQAQFENPELYQGLMRGEAEFQRAWIESPEFMDAR